MMKIPQNAENKSRHRPRPSFRTDRIEGEDTYIRRAVFGERRELGDTLKNGQVIGQETPEAAIFRPKAAQLFFPLAPRPTIGRSVRGTFLAVAAVLVGAPSDVGDLEHRLHHLERVPDAVADVLIHHPLCTTILTPPAVLLFPFLLLLLPRTRSNPKSLLHQPSGIVALQIRSRRRSSPARRGKVG